MPRNAKLILDDKSLELPVVVGTEGEKAIDIARLRSETGYVTLDNGLTNTGTCESRITFLDGERGILHYRGITIEELAEKSSFVETAYLVAFGELPTHDQAERFSRQLNASSLIHEDMLHLYIAFPQGAHPMGVLATMVSALSAFYPIPDELDADAEHSIITNLVSKVRTIAALSYKKSVGEPIVYPSVNLKFVPNFLHMMFASPVENYEIDPDVVKALDLFLVLHADHEQNCSTSTVRMVGSSLANVYSAVCSGICALSGKRHGGANQDAMEMLETIRVSGASPAQFVEQAKRKETRLAGFGHRVYKCFDPRAKILKEHCAKLLGKPGVMNRCFEIALQLEEIALKDEYFLSRHLYPNVDFYSGMILKAIGIPLDMFPVLFAIARTPGWLAHWREMRHAEGFKLARPRQVYTGPAQRPYVPMSERR